MEMTLSYYSKTSKFSRQYSLDTISYTQNSSTELAGRARLGNIRVYLNNKLEAEVEVNESGAWKTRLSNIKLEFTT